MAKSAQLQVEGCRSGPFERVRVRPRWLCRALALALLLAPAVLNADVIYLKNGQKISGTVSREDAKQVFCEIAGGEIGIPRSRIDHIEKSPTPPTSESAKPEPETQAAESANPEGKIQQSDLPQPPAPAEGQPPAASSVIKDNAVDRAALQRLVEALLRDNNPENQLRLILGYYEAGQFLVRSDDNEGAISLYREALTYVPDNLPLTLALGDLLIKQNHDQAAIDALSPAESRNPKSADVHLLLGEAYYFSEELPQAIDEWKKAVALRDDPRLRQALAKAQKENAATDSFEEIESVDFLVRYDATEARGLGQQILGTLEDELKDLELDLDYYPHEKIIVLLYSRQAFRDVTSSPSWADAVNDGKIRVPISGLTSVTPDLARTLKHEMTHSFVHQITGGRCPVWFNEGLAQLEEGKTTAAWGTQLSRALAAGQIPPYSALEGSFMNLRAEQAGLVYAKSLAALEYLRDTFGMDEVRSLLKGIATAPSFDSLLQDRLRLNYPSFEREVALYVQNRYGS